MIEEDKEIIRQYENADSSLKPLQEWILKGDRAQNFYNKRLAGFIKNFRELIKSRTLEIPPCQDFQNYPGKLFSNPREPAVTELFEKLEPLLKPYWYKNRQDQSKLESYRNTDETNWMGKIIN